MHLTRALSDRLVFTTMIVAAVVTMSAVHVGTQPLQEATKRFGTLVLDVRKAIDVQNAAALVAEAQAEKAREAARLSAAARAEQAKLAEAERLAQETRNAFRKAFVAALAELKNKSDGEVRLYRSAFTALAISGIVFALLSSVFGFLRWSISAGVCGIITTAVLTAPNVFSVRENLTFYSYTSSQAYALQLEAQLIEQPSQADTDRWKSRFFQLVELVANPPSIKEPDQLTRKIIQSE